ncbi:GNAT family N-acetyltransferase [Haloarchaeobius sp. HRN-SO-5]|uniref:GNAT family N-acetyltransferase n=1 Tax=Haloarchaeobius sp. HRN-SO-5 TaxID=3446118 RepID=UPI003EB9F6A5
MTPADRPVVGEDDVRRATPVDLPVLRALQSRLDEPVSGLFDDLPPGETLVTTDRGVAVGYVHAVTGETAHLTELVVAPAYRRAGRGRRLLETLLSVLRGAGCRVVTLTVATENESAQALYEDAGFERVALLQGHYEDGDAYRYSRTL